MRKATVIVREKVGNNDEAWPSLEGRAIIQKQFDTMGEAQVYMVENPGEFLPGYIYHLEEMYFE